MVKLASRIRIGKPGLSDSRSLRGARRTNSAEFRRCDRPYRVAVKANGSKRGHIRNRRRRQNDAWLDKRHRTAPPMQGALRSSTERLEREHVCDRRGEAEQQSQSYDVKTLWLSHLPCARTVALSLTWQTSRAEAHPQFLLTSHFSRLHSSQLPSICWSAPWVRQALV
jgi:hypothetical protein